MLQNSRDAFCNICLISGDQSLNSLLKEYLNNSNIQLKCTIETNYKTAENKFEEIASDLIIIDIDTLNLTAQDLINRVTNNLQLNNTPKIVITKNNDMDIKLYAFEMGIDEFVLKPIIVHELIARIKNISKRYKKFIGTKIIVAGNITMNLVTNTVTVGNNKIKISNKEFGILKLFIENSQRVFSREEILLTVWKNPQYINMRTIDVHINRLRFALGKNDNGRSYIKTVRSAGYGIDLSNQEDSIFNEYNNNDYSYSIINHNDTIHNLNYGF
jgi:two-component system phosphate regulon response regulator PhoB